MDFVAVVAACAAAVVVIVVDMQSVGKFAICWQNGKLLWLLNSQLESSVRLPDIALPGLAV